MKIIAVSLSSLCACTINKYFITIKYFCLLFLNRVREREDFFIFILLPYTRTHTHSSVIFPHAAVLLLLCLYWWMIRALSLLQTVAIVTHTRAVLIGQLRDENVVPRQTNVGRCSCCTRQCDSFPLAMLLRAVLR
jgi:hypothetical protein